MGRKLPANFKLDMPLLKALYKLQSTLGKLTKDPMCPDSIIELEDAVESAIASWHDGRPSYLVRTKVLFHESDFI